MRGATPLLPGIEATGPAAAPFASRVDASGRVRRLYFPAAATVGSPEDRARQLLLQEGVQLGFRRGSPELERVSVRDSPSGTHVRLRQLSGGIPVWGAEAVISFDARLVTTVLASDLEPLAPEAAPPAALEPATACSLAVQRLGGAGGRLAPLDASIYQRLRDGVWGLEYRVAVVCAQPVGDWEIWIDATSGAVREVRDRTVFEGAIPRPAATAAGARIFLPDPCLGTGDPSLRDASDTDAAVPEAAYVSVTLEDLDPPVRGWYRLSGPHARIEDWESPVVAPDSSASPEFVRTRSEPGFEDVMAYYHMDAVQRWYRALGFTNANALPQIADPHGLGGQDNSKFVPTLHRIAFGEGGVDDAEDAEVIVHEYAHATQFDIVPTWGTGGHTSAMGEGFGDYLANSYAWSIFPERVEAWNGVFQWDGHNEYWPGRRAIDTSLLYPRDATASLYRAGTLWCSALTDALYSVRDRAVMDRLVVDHHYALTGSATMEDAANAILAADVALYAGAHLAVLVETFGRWGLVDPSAWRAVQIVHAPLDARAAADGSPDLEARVTSTVAAIDPSTVVAWVRSRGGAWTRVPLDVRGEDRYGAALDLPGSEDLDLEYWIEARDALGNDARVPATAPETPWSLHVGRVAEGFEADAGWQAGAPGDGATSGRWVRAIPVGTVAQPAADHTEAGSACYVTGNGAPGAPAGEADVDGGATTLLSPVWDLRGASGARIIYWRWFSNDQGTFPDEDLWSVDVSNDGGLGWTALESTSVSEAGWRRMEFDLVPILGTLDQVRLRFVARDAGGASLVEAAVDDVLLQVRTSTDVASAPPARGALLLAPHPNPCNPTTTLRFRLPSPLPVRLVIYDTRGRRVRRTRLGGSARGRARCPLGRLRRRRASGPERHLPRHSRRRGRSGRSQAHRRPLSRAAAGCCTRCFSRPAIDAPHGAARHSPGCQVRAHEVEGQGAPTGRIGSEPCSGSSARRSSLRPPRVPTPTRRASAGAHSRIRNRTCSRRSCTARRSRR